MRNNGQINQRTYLTIMVLGMIALGLSLLRFPTREYILSVLTFVFIYTALGQSWNILGGFAKQFSLGHAAFFGLGAFLTAFGCQLGAPALLSLVIAGILVALVSYPLGRICFAAKGPYFTIITLALAEIFRIIFLWRPELSGSEGLTLPVNFFSKNINMYYLALTMAAGSILIVIMFLLPNGLLSLVYKTGTQMGPLAVRISRKEKTAGSSSRVV